MIYESEIVLWGVGIEAEKFYYRYLKQKNGGKIIKVIDSFHSGGDFHGIKICSPDEELNDCKYFIVVATSEEAYSEIRSKLIKLGYIEFENFIFGKNYGKKIAILNGNCHIGVYKKYLELSKKFIEIYSFYPLSMIQDNEIISKYALESADLFIYQPIKEDSGYTISRSDKECLKMLKKECQVLCVPNLYPLGIAIYPTQIKGETYLTRDKSAYIFHRDWLLDEAYNTVIPKTSRNIIQYMFSYKFDDRSIKNGWDRVLKEVKKREQRWDIKISKYIYENYKSVLMFNDYAHPSNELLLYICRKIARRLGIYDIDDSRFSVFLDNVDSFVLPQVKSILQLNYDKKVMRENHGVVLNDSYRYGMDLSEYVREYVFVFHNRVIE